MPRLCPKCGIENSGAYSYCYSCGAKLNLNAGYLPSIAAGMSIIAAIASLPLWFIGIFATLSLLSLLGGQTCAGYCFSARDILLGVVSLLAFPLGFAGGLLILEQRRRIIGYVGFIIMMFAGIIALGTPLTIVGVVMILFSIPGLSILFTIRDWHEAS